MKKNKHFYSIVSILSFLFLLTACANDESAENTPENDSALESENSDANDEKDIKTNDGEQDGDNNSKEEENVDGNPSANTEEGETGNEEDSTLDGYSAEEIEYARIWLQLGDNQEIDRLNAQHVPAGHPINVLDEDSAAYPEDVITLSGGPEEGMVTYSSNGDGTINVYDVSRRLAKMDDEEELQKEYEAILEEQELVEVDTGNPEDIKKLIDESLTIQYEDTFEKKLEEGSENEDNNTSDNSGENGSENGDESILDDYSAEEIEYARIWLQLSELEEPDNETLYVRYISAGEPINEVDENSAEYPEDVTVLDGGRQAGVVTYGSNGDGTINVYNIPPRWETNEDFVDEEAQQKTYQKILDEVELIEVDTGNPEDVKKVIDEYLIIK